MKLNCLTWGDSASAKTAVLIHGVTSNAQSWVRVGPRLAAQAYYISETEYPRPITASIAMILMAF